MRQQVVGRERTLRRGLRGGGMERTHRVLTKIKLVPGPVQPGAEDGGV